MREKIGRILVEVFYNGLKVLIVIIFRSEFELEDFYCRVYIKEVLLYLLSSISVFF